MINGAVMTTNELMEHSSPEERILAAAAEEFAANGFFGARTQTIADAAGVNKAMLHYYFRTKENLYGQVIAGALRRILNQVGQAWLSQDSVESRLDKVVDAYMASASGRFSEISKTWVPWLQGLPFPRSWKELVVNSGSVWRRPPISSSTLSACVRSVL
jgi:AcrR family transcriptional regulator